MSSFIQEAIRDNDARWFLADIVVPERRSVINSGDMWFLGDIIVTKDNIKTICNDRLKALIKLLSNSTNSQLVYLRSSIKNWKDILETINE